MGLGPSKGLGLLPTNGDPGVISTQPTFAGMTTISSFLLHYRGARNWMTTRNRKLCSKPCLIQQQHLRLGSLIDGQRARCSQNPTADLSEDVSRGTICPDVNGLPTVLNRKSSGCDSGLQLHDLSIIRTYRDEGESGLKLKNRAGLAQLLNDVSADQVDFEYILVYDVSRWGRFQ